MHIVSSPAAIARDALNAASIPDPHSRLTVAPGTDVGRPASSTAMRATLRLSSPAWLASPKYTSSGSTARIALDQRLDDRRREIVGPGARERAAELADRCADGVVDVDLRHA